MISSPPMSRVNPAVAGSRQAPQQVVGDVLHSDGLAAGVDPAWANHDRQTFDQMAEHLEGSAAGPNDVGGAQNGRTGAARLEDLGHLQAADQMFREVIPEFSQSAEIKDALKSRRVRYVHKVFRGLPVPLGKRANRRLRPPMECTR